MKLAIVLTIAGVLSGAAVLVVHAHAEQQFNDPGAIYVYRHAICDDTADTNCRMTPESHTLTFPTSAACAAYATIQMQHAKDPREAAYCVKMWEA